MEKKKYLSIILIVLLAIALIYLSVGGFKKSSEKFSQIDLPSNNARIPEINSLSKLIKGYKQESASLSMPSNFLMHNFLSLSKSPRNISIIIKSGLKDYEFSADLADNLLSQTKGLMFKDFLPRGSGMLFVWSKEEIRSFWMMNTLIPLDMLFIDKNKTIVDINKNAASCKGIGSCDSFISKPAQYVLEINGGLSDKLGIKIGDEVNFDLN